jgi:hypothetical protein
MVRMGPNMVSVGDPAEIDKIYRIHDTLQKVRIWMCGLELVPLTKFIP